MVNRDASNRDEDLADTWDEPDIGASDEDSEDLDVDEVTSSNRDEEDSRIRQFSSIFATDALALRRLKPDVSRAERLSMMVNRDASNRDEDLAQTLELQMGTVKTWTSTR
eukprot:s3393_g12.t1